MQGPWSDWCTRLALMSTAALFGAIGGAAIGVAMFRLTGRVGGHGLESLGGIIYGGPSGIVAGVVLGFAFGRSLTTGSRLWWSGGCLLGALVCFGAILIADRLGYW